MNTAMKTMLILMAAAMGLVSAHAEVLTPAEREALLQKLEEMKANAESKVDARYRAAIAAYQNAVASDEAAMELYLNCVEKVNFKDQQKKNSDFREWKRKEEDKLSDPGIGMALRIQLRWLILTLRAASEKSDRDQLVSGAREVVDGIVNEIEKLKNQRQILNQSAVGSLFARAYEIGEVKAENWVFSPGQIGEVYDKILLPPLRAARQPELLRTAWLRRISQETRMQEFLPANHDNGNGNGKRRIGMAEDMRGSELDQYIAETVPELQWTMEMDLFRNGDERNAAVRMLAHLEKNLGHKSARKWATELTGLLSGNGAQAAPAAP
jgi:hypothetical protein